MQANYLINQYEIGKTMVTSIAWVIGATGIAVDPSSVTLRVLMPGSSSPVVYVYGVDAGIVKDSVGQYHANIVLNTSGIVSYRWEAGGSYPDALENTVRVLPSNIISG